MPKLGCCTDDETTVYHPVGDTDSEAVFCAMLNALRAEFKALPTLPVLYEAIQKLCSEIVRGHEGETIFNFLLGCGQFTQFAFSWPGAREGSEVWNGLHYLIRSHPFESALLKDIDYRVDFGETNCENDRVAIIATKPLTHQENWIEMERGQLLMFDNGLAYSKPYECAAVERCGRGLSSRAIPRTEICPLSVSEINGRLFVREEKFIVKHPRVDLLLSSNSHSFSRHRHRHNTSFCFFSISTTSRSCCDTSCSRRWARRGPTTAPR